MLKSPRIVIVQKYFLTYLNVSSRSTIQVDFDTHVGSIRTMAGFPSRLLHSLAIPSSSLVIP
jgi:hypothetical protein